MAGQIKVTLKKSGIGRKEYFTKVLKGLGLTRLNKTVVLPDTPEIRGMINKVSHMVVVED
ncbi:MAG: 50S ribosomal protein L30 [Syntrophotalea acetylenica]|jgi:large subunit ribosomal protein L30|uniref:50S ribosomal protein L30 n=1 Tax=Syntrophotalea acetylenica TaxID=29542 RepID=A0A1L3GEQ9_SYNAC|nr:50S ribosomal protein L30 [Syntrophotalea acetylenica]APG24178.1 50S ribosomal protein L30 [Syntrophotalea acetylenica]APG44759.1 50S ribosomal protein L30 [Syntrophotalea acetylenica]MDD4456222.1 50S ribosomal protein L30 [Syntrophotalea acetylenica]MDY0261863.1 50S ribosomal protein L30 [Syntrophotalea acetylenica]